MGIIPMLPMIGRRFNAMAPAEEKTHHVRYEQEFKHHPARLDLDEIDRSLQGVQLHWTEINDELDRRHIGRKDTFTDGIRFNMLSAYACLDSLLIKRVRPFSRASYDGMLEINDCVHYGTDSRLRLEYNGAIQENREKFSRNIGLIHAWVSKHLRRHDHPLKMAAEVYVGILTRPQLFIEGNHRTGSLISSWISLYYGFPPFVLSFENALDYFEPSALIKYCADKSSWSGKRKLPKYNAIFREFWEGHIDERYVVRVE
jgi:hypothetical protein